MQSSIILSLNSFMASSPLLIKIVPILADIFVFSYPLYLIYLYFFTHDSIARWQRLWHKPADRQHKHIALSILSSFIGSVIVNYSIKAFIEQPRPYQVLDLLINPKESLILNAIPTDSFPSDHAAVGATIAAAVLIRGYQTKNKSLIIAWWVFVGFALIMDICRITMGVHRPIDIIAGIVIGIVVALILSCFHSLMLPLYNWLISLQEKIFWLLSSQKRQEKSKDRKTINPV